MIIKTKLKPAGTPRPGFSHSQLRPRVILREAALLAGLSILAHNAVALEPSSQECTRDNVAAADATADKRLVIIIDDMGNNLRRGRQALALPGKLTFAVIPYTPYGAQLAESAHLSGKEVMLHAPMSTVEHLPLGMGGLTPELSQEEFRDTISAALDMVPHARGINNHMGSDLTQRREQMSWLMEELRWQDKYFVDSRTSGRSVAASVAEEFRVPNLSRHVFLDNERTREAIDERFRELLEMTDKHGLAVAIGHPYPQTIDYLRDILPLLPELGVQLVFVSEALPPETSIDVADISARLAENPQPDC